jgi:hypothetical protein
MELSTISVLFYGCLETVKSTLSPFTQSVTFYNELYFEYLHKYAHFVTEYSEMKIMFIHC